MMLRRYHNKKDEQSETEQETNDVHDMTKKELLEYAKENEIEVSDRMKKDEILSLIVGDSGGQEDSGENNGENSNGNRDDTSDGTGNVEHDQEPTGD